MPQSMRRIRGCARDCRWRVCGSPSRVNYLPLPSMSPGAAQDIIDAALLGLASDLKSMAEERAATPPADGYRFPGSLPAHAAGHVVVQTRSVVPVTVIGSDDAECRCDRGE